MFQSSARLSAFGCTATLFGATLFCMARSGEFGKAVCQRKDNDQEIYKINVEQKTFSTKVTIHVYDTQEFDKNWKFFNTTPGLDKSLRKRTEIMRFIRPVEFDFPSPFLVTDRKGFTVNVFEQLPGRVW